MNDHAHVKAIHSATTDLLHACDDVAKAINLPILAAHNKSQPQTPDKEEIVWCASHSATRMLALTLITSKLIHTHLVAVIANCMHDNLDDTLEVQRILNEMNTIVSTVLPPAFAKYNHEFMLCGMHNIATGQHIKMIWQYIYDNPNIDDEHACWVYATGWDESIQAPIYELHDLSVELQLCLN